MSVGVRQLTYSCRTGPATTTVIVILCGMQSANFSVATQFKHLSFTAFAPSTLQAGRPFRRSTGEASTIVQLVQVRQRFACSMSELTWPTERVRAMHCMSVLPGSYA